METIICRARLAADCHHDRESGQAFGAPGAEMYEDGTWNGHSIVCDPCYCAIMPHTRSGMGLNEELEPTIKRLRTAERLRTERERRDDELRATMEEGPGGFEPTGLARKREPNERIVR